jgi:hypothetical protein
MLKIVEISPWILFLNSSTVWEFFGKLNFLNIPTNTDHKVLNQGNVGAKDRG